MNHTVTRYLESKRTVDNRARSRRVRDRLLGALPPEPYILDVGCGTGSTVPRLLEWGVDAGQYRGVDSDDGVIAFAQTVRPATLGRTGHAVTDTDRGFRAADLFVTFETGNALATLEATAPVDLVVAQAFADLVPVTELLAGVEAALVPGGLAYLPITFDGGTIFQPDHPADDAVERAFHAAIDQKEGRDSRAGRHLVDAARRGEGTLLAVDASDWVVRPHENGYPADEAYFLDRILDFVETALADADVGDDWLTTRREQLAAGELTYVAHQYDILYRTPERPAR
jgi:SAM-dependent methyltransferase